MPKRLHKLTGECLKRHAESGRAFERESRDECEWLNCTSDSCVWRDCRFYRQSLRSTRFVNCRFERCRWWGQPMVFDEQALSMLEGHEREMFEAIVKRYDVAR